MRRMTKPTAIIIHHSLTMDSATVSWDAIKKYHTQTNGFDDIGYHFGIEDIEEHPIVMQGRSLDFCGAHTRENNNTIGVCVVGDFDKEELSEAKFQLLVKQILNIMYLYPHLVPEDVLPHRFYAPYKSCPGNKFPMKRLLYEVRKRWEGRTWVA